MAAAFRAVALDFGTGDGAFARRLAAADATRLVFGLDASPDNLRELSRRAAGKPSRGGLPNLRFGRLALADAPGALAALADELTVMLPWGSLLQAVALGTAELGHLRGLCKPGARLDVVFGYGAASERATIGALGLPPPEALSAMALAGGYRQAGFAVELRPMALDDVAALPTTWARKLAFSGRERRFWRISGRALDQALTPRSPGAPASR